MQRVDFLGAPSNFLVQWFRNFDSEDLGSLGLGMWFRRRTVGTKTLTLR